MESEVTASFLYDGAQATGSFYSALKAALKDGSAGELKIGADISGWTGSALVSALSAEGPADGAMTCEATFTLSGALDFESDTTPEPPPFVS